MGKDQCKKTDSEILFQGEKFIPKKTDNGIDHRQDQNCQDNLGQVGMKVEYPTIGKRWFVHNLFILDFSNVVI